MRGSEFILPLLYRQVKVMGRKCVCQICKAKGNTDVFYKVTTDQGKNKYYCNKEEYVNFINEKEKRHDLLKFVAEDVLEYEDGQIVPPVMVKKIEKLHGFYDYEVIHNCFKVQKEAIQYWINNKNFSSEHGMASYVMKIIESNINDEYEKWKHQKNVTKQQDTTDLDVEIINETKHATTVKSGNDISEFLDEEDI